MIDSLFIIEKTGNLLWSFGKVQHDLVNACISNEIIPKNAPTGSCRLKNFIADFLQDSDKVYISFHPSSLHISYAQELLKLVSEAFHEECITHSSSSSAGSSSHSSDVNDDHNDDYAVFTHKFKSILASLQAKTIQDPQKQGKVNNFNNSNKNEKSMKSKKDDNHNRKASSSNKEERVWGDSKLSQEKLASLDYSNSMTDLAQEGNEDNGDNHDVTKGTLNGKDKSLRSKKIQEQSKKSMADMWIEKSSMGERTKQGIYETKSIAPPINEKIKEATESTLQKFFGGFSFERKIDQNMLDPVMFKMKEHLIQKNVAADIASTLCESVSENLLGTKLSSFSSLTTRVKMHLEEQLTRILTPKTSTDILREIMKSKEKEKPYSIVFVGVNGVGKSTNLAKVCFWLLQNKFKILIAACDTFRSGAVEQLGVHARNLKSLIEHDTVVDLFEKGYGKDSAAIAKDAIQHAAINGHDVVLIDTAGRMQNNEPLMRALAKLVTINNPDKIIFVGEALVGNEAVDQLTKFNLALKDYSGIQNPRQIDGMILTKFDTIDDKVGAALTMTYITSQPILFVGTGQTYTDLRKLDIQIIVDTLLI